jgi:hypothetical protein
MSTLVLTDKQVRTGAATASGRTFSVAWRRSPPAPRPFISRLCSNTFVEYTLYGVFFLVISWTQVISPGGVLSDDLSAAATNAAVQAVQRNAANRAGLPRLRNRWPGSRR